MPGPVEVVIIALIDPGAVAAFKAFTVGGCVLDEHAGRRIGFHPAHGHLIYGHIAGVRAPGGTGKAHGDRTAGIAVEIHGGQAPLVALVTGLCPQAGPGGAVGAGLYLQGAHGRAVHVVVEGKGGRGVIGQVEGRPHQPAGF